jgi:hypothetical protein
VLNVASFTAGSGEYEIIGVVYKEEKRDGDEYNCAMLHRKGGEWLFYDKEDVYRATVDDVHRGKPCMLVYRQD